MHEAAVKMIDAAERLVAEGGLTALTVQAVQQAAGQRNKSAVQYHFGGRHGLIQSLVAARTAPANERRTTMLLSLDRDPSTRDLVEVLIVPLAESVLSRRPSYWARFLLQALGDPTTALAGLHSVGDQALRVTHSRLEESLVHLPVPLRALRAQSMAGYACAVLAAYEVGKLPPEVDGDVLVAELVDACCGLVEAPSTAALPPHVSHRRASAIRSRS